jgi:hypothetical protein
MQMKSNHPPTTAGALKLAVSAEQQLAETRRELESLGVYIAALVGRLGAIDDGGRSS